MTTEDFKDYKVLAQIGRGATGMVYRARHKKSGQLVALKVVHEQLLQNDDHGREKALFVQNVVLNARMDHPNIVGLKECFVEKGKFIVVSELLVGDTVDAILASGIELPVELRLDWLMQLLQGISYAHLAGVMHGDLKPANLFVTVENQVKILDFGLSRELLADDEATGPGLLSGAPAYLAPETYRLNNRINGLGVGKAGDVFAIGVIAYRLLNGCLPFGLNETMSATDTVTRLAVNYNAGEPIPRMNTGRNGIPVEVADAVMECLALTPQKRAASVEWLLAVIMNARRAPLDRKALGSLAAYFKKSPAKLAAVVQRNSSPPPKPDTEAVPPKSSPPAGRRRRMPIWLMVFLAAAVLAAGLLRYRPEWVGLNAVLGECEKQDSVICFIAGKQADKARKSARIQKMQMDACEKASGEACMLLGRQFETGTTGMTRDAAKAAVFYGKACDLENPAGCARLGKMFSQGKGGVPGDDTRAVELFRKACNAGYIAACGDLGNMHLWARGGLPQSEDQAVALYTRACDAKDMTGCARLGRMHEAGKGGLEQKPRTAVTLYEMACRNGNATGCAYLGRMYEAGQGGLSKNIKKATELYLRACEHHVAFGCHNASNILSKRPDTMSDPTQAQTLRIKACSLGFEKACRQ
ncbi:MAG: protein kinase [Deltaproteobacteria bacterium]|nr:protein kinase [Deltaproteobacteria bacterium]